MSNVDNMDVLYQGLQRRLLDCEQGLEVYDDDQETVVGHLTHVEIDASDPENRKIKGNIDYHDGNTAQVVLYCENAQEKGEEENG